MRASKNSWIPSKTALVTGASSGLGLEICKLLQQKGVRLLATGRKQLPHITLQADLIHERQKVVDLIEKEVPDLVINCAGFGVYGPATGPGHTLDLLELNANAPIEITINAAKALIRAKKEGMILNVSSAAMLIPMPYLALYTAAKAALTSFSRSFDAEMKPFGVRILVSLPGQCDTEFAERASQGRYREKKGLKKEWVARRILQQIEKQKTYEVLDWKFHLCIYLARLFPNWGAKMIMAELSKRI